MVINVTPRTIDARSYAANETLNNGAAIHIRASRSDKLRLLEHFAGLNTSARYFRFSGYKRYLTPEDVVRYTELGFNRHVGLAAIISQDRRERFIGIGRYIRKDAAQAEIALAVLDEYQGVATGPLLIRHFGRIGHASGINQFEADAGEITAECWRPCARAGAFSITPTAPGSFTSLSGAQSCRPRVRTAANSIGRLSNRRPARRRPWLTSM